MHGRHLRDQGGGPGWQAAVGCRENQLHEKVRKGRLIATSWQHRPQRKEPPNSPLGGSKSPDGDANRWGGWPPEATLLVRSQSDAGRFVEEMKPRAGRASDRYIIGPRLFVLLLEQQGLHVRVGLRAVEYDEA